MTEPKISFGFTKLSKKPSVIPSASTKPKETVQFIDCVEDNNIKILNEVVEEKQELVIPLRPSTGVNDIKSKIKRVAEANSGSSDNKPTLEELAAKEIVQETTKAVADEPEINTHIVPLVSNPPTGEKESSIEDYDNIPIEKFGLAMLRGMGWEPGKGIGKNAKIAPPVTQVVRPKGMGLGADKAMKANQVKSNDESNLKLVKGSYVRLTGGSHKDCYGQVEGFDEDTGRAIVKLARGGNVVTVGEFMIQVVAVEEYSKNSKVLNMTKYEEYMTNEKKTKKENQSDSNESKSENDYETKRRRNSHSVQKSDKHANANERHTEVHKYSSSSQRHSRHSDDKYHAKSSSNKSKERIYEDCDDKSRKQYSRSHESYRSHKSKKHKRDRSPRR